jgi:DHA1 family bicyclomycin/chloramphenicol resistance-like MFS transporter
MTQAPPKSPRIIIVILGALFTVSPFSIDMYLPAFPQIATSLHCTTAQVSYSLPSYFLGLAVGQLFYGPLLDRFGRKRPLHIGLSVYVAATLACLVAPTYGALIAMRLLQALGGCVAQVAAVTMVNDFFPLAERPKVFSLLMLILGVSPLLAPTVGGVVATALGWQWIFILLAGIVAAIAMVAAAFLPVGQAPDRMVILRPVPIIMTFARLLAEPTFRTYALAGACSFSGLFVYVAGSPIIFMDAFHVEIRTYGLIFALLSIGFIGGNQVNILVSKYFPARRILTTALLCQGGIGLLFAVGAAQGWYGLAATTTLLFGLLACVGFTYPNASAIALSPFTRNVGSASALLGFLQVGIGAIASAGVGALEIHTIAPIMSIVTAMAVIGLVILLVGSRQSAAPAPAAATGP